MYRIKGLPWKREPLTGFVLPNGVEREGFGIWGLISLKNQSKDDEYKRS